MRLLDKKEINILGKHPSILTFPKDFFKDKITMGLNHAAIMFDTTFAFTGHDNVLEDYKEAGINNNKIITWCPTVENSVNSFYGDCIFMPTDKNGKFEVNSYLKNLELTPEWLVELIVDKAISGDKTFPYTNWGTCLHCAIFYCLFNGHKEINLYGCNNTKGTIEGFNDNDINVDYWKYHTDLIIKICNNKGIKICLIESN